MLRLLRSALVVLLAVIPGIVPAHEAMGDGSGVAFAVLMDNRLVAVRLADGTVAAEVRLGPTPSPEVLALRYPGHLLAASADGRTLFVLVAGSATAPDRVALVDVAALQVRASPALPGAGGTYRSLAVGPKSGQLYLFGNIPGIDGVAVRTAGSGVAARGVVVTRLDPSSGRVAAAWTDRPADGRDWFVYQGAVAPDERAVYVSYHGPDTTGIDRFGITADGLRPCPIAAAPGSGCIPAHGGFAFLDDGLLVATGDATIVATDRAGARRGDVDTGLANDHLMEFAVDAAADRLYAVGPCGYAGGFSEVDLSGLRAQATPRATPEVLITPRHDIRHAGQQHCWPVIYPVDTAASSANSGSCGTSCARLRRGR